VNTLSDILNTSYLTQGIQNMEAFYDSYIFDLKVQNNSEYHNIVLIEKLEFDYSAETIDRIKNSLSVNFGNTGVSSPLKSNGTGFLGTHLDKKNKKVLLIGTKTMTSGNIIPIVYSYDINKHSVVPIFPKTEDIAQFNSMTSRGTIVTDTIPILRFAGPYIFVCFQTNISGWKYVHKIILKFYNQKIKLHDYEIHRYDQIHSLDITDAGTNYLGFKFGEYYGFLDKRVAAIDIPGLYLDDDNLILALDNNFTVLGIDG